MEMASTRGVQVKEVHFGTLGFWEGEGGDVGTFGYGKEIS